MPVQGAAFLCPKAGEQPGLVAVVNGADGAAEKYQAGVVVAGAQELAGVPGQYDAVEGDQHKLRFDASQQQRGIVQPQPGAALPIGDVKDREIDRKPMAG